MPRTIRLVLVGAAVAASIIPAASPAIAETGATDVTIVAQADAQDGNVTQTVPVGGGHSAGILDQTGLDAAAPAALLAMTVGLSALAGAAPAVAADGTTDVTVQVATDDGNLAWSAPTRLLIDGMYHQPGGGTD